MARVAPEGHEQEADRRQRAQEPDHAAGVVGAEERRDQATAAPGR